MKTVHSVNKYLPYVLFLLLGLAFLAKPVLDMDEIWNYGFASYISNGLQPYRDFNMIQTPLSAYIACVVLLIFGDNLFVFRVLGAVLFALTFGLVYTVCRRIIKNTPVAFALSSFCGALCSLIWMYNYNHVILLCIIAIIYCEYRLETECGINPLALNLIIGLLYGLAPVIKQSTGAVLFLLNIAWCGYKLMIRQTEKGVFILRILIAVIPSTLFVLGNIIFGTFEEFFDYAVTGVQTFTHYEAWVDYLLSSPTDFVIGIMPLGVTMLSAYTLWTGKSRVNRVFHLEAILLCWAGAAVAYPICDFVHACVAAIPFLIPLLCCIGEIHTSKWESALCCMMAALVLCCSSFLLLKELPKYKNCELLHFNGLPICHEIEEQIKTVDAYLLKAGNEGIEVLIADEDAAAYMIPIEKYYKDFNLLLVGNVGSKSIEELLWREKAIYLIARTEESLGKQAHTALITYIKENYSKIGEVFGFDAYTPR